MEKETYTSQTSYKGLQEAIEVILQQSDDNEYDLAVIPPDPSALTDEEEDRYSGPIANDNRIKIPVSKDNGPVAVAIARSVRDELLEIVEKQA
ncbi:unnamed protein product [Arctia plantaginis]|uniref:Uncharacterized protein n=1 Tax=Arctia plantaginis TaxID=874455 RepID=A0A8S0ZWS7_ARCPL|nr:unnamed protein product [Arctia plantaginis]